MKIPARNDSLELERAGPVESSPGSGGDGLGLGLEYEYGYGYGYNLSDYWATAWNAKASGWAFDEDRRTPLVSKSRPTWFSVTPRKGSPRVNKFDFSYMDPVDGSTDQAYYDQDDERPQAPGNSSGEPPPSRERGQLTRDNSSFKGMMHRNESSDIAPLDPAEMYAAECNDLGIHPLVSIQDMLKR